ncbi:PTS sugar transporter subunit IIC [Geosporobacter ferrireducens]|uniref:Permease IIC component n=1 Tax=Geosporobacter ferrireducens TaxID=1424294 RepID=A0A1D8GCK7_9FIRM|nr:PTS sugar transporter subunit IIC [Geosporobacter ferrireducens]AOT68626.1 PTS lactose transporter subunit IIC [Geosporobacter ferrireducens]MTI54098.1 PTS sugar transporter subunit IIC [Geosporobacter ferrireducens]
MSRVQHFLENKLLPFATKLASQRHLAAIRDGFISFMPFLIIGSLFIIIQDFPVPGWEELQTKLFGPDFNQFIILPKRVTYDIMALYIAAAISYKLAQQYKIDAFSAALLGIASFILVTPITTTISIDGSSHLVTRVMTVGGWYGTQGLLVALIIAIVSTELFNYFIKKKLVIKMPEGVPPAVTKAFMALVPGFIILVVMLFIRFVFLQTPYEYIHEFIYQIVAAPMTALVANNLLGAIGTVFAISLLWCIGLNGGAIVNGILRPFWVPLQEQNLAAIEMGREIPNIITEQFFDLIWIGGAGATLAVVFVLIAKAKSTQYKELGKLSLAPGLFNINEPIMFGLPVVLNPLMMIPLILGPAAITIVNYFAMATHLVARPTGVIIPWTTPPIIQGFLVTGHWSGAVLQIIDILMVMAIWWPFISMMDKNKQLEEESAEEKA